MKIVIFLHGTIIMHHNAQGRTREERVRQGREREASVADYGSYLPIGGAAAKLKAWRLEGAEILYLSSRRCEVELLADAQVLLKYGFPPGPILYRQPGEAYADIAEKIMPDILIEDDCESIGGPSEMTITSVKPELRAKIKSIVVPEFGGIDHLPDDLFGLAS